MQIRKILLVTLFLLVLATPVWALTKQDLSIYQALHIAEKVEIGNFTSAVKIDSLWIVKGHNLNNLKPGELMINAGTGLIEYAMNVTPKAIILGEATYEYAGVVYPYSEEFYETGVICSGLRIYQNNSHYFKMKQAIFIKNIEGFVAYFMTGGSHKTK